MSGGKISLLTTSGNCVGSIVGYVKSDTTINYTYFTSDLSGYDKYGSGTPESESNILSYDSTTFELDGTVSIGNYTGTSLIDALNAAADYYIPRDYSRWLLNKGNNAVTFTINGRTNPIKMNYQIILTPSLASEGGMTFDGWYTDDGLTTLFNESKINSNTSLYGQFSEKINYTITFETRREGVSVAPITVPPNSDITLPSSSIREHCVVASWETENGEKVGLSLAMPSHNITLYAIWGCAHIKTFDDFNDFSKAVDFGKSFYGTTVFLDSDLSLAGKSFKPIGKSSRYFRGVFDGQGHMISNLKMTSSSQYVGLFGYSRGLTIKNVILGSSCSITSSYSSSSYSAYIGGIVGYCDTDNGPCTIENSVNMGGVTFSRSISRYSLFIGGIAGHLYPNDYESTVKNCANYGDVTHSGTSGYSYIGGIVGNTRYSSYRRVYIYNCLNHGTITHNGTTKNYLYLGGVAGNVSSTTLNNCMSLGDIKIGGDISPGNHTGSVIGSAHSNTYINYCYYTNNLNDYEMCESLSSTLIANTPSIPTRVPSALARMNSQTGVNGWNKWLVNNDNRTLTFIINGNKGVSLSSQAIIIPEPALTGSLKFSGWYNDTYYTTLSKMDEITQDLTYYGLYGKIVEISFNATGGTLSLPSKKASVNYSYGELPDSTKNQCRFAGWYTDPVEGSCVDPSSAVSISYDHTLYAHWIINKYTITFESNGGSICANITQDYNTSFTLPSPNRTGYTFVRWCSDQNLTTEYTVRVIEPKNVTLYAEWAANNYSVSFDVKGGEEEAPVNVTFGQRYGKLPTPKKDGCEFLWWDMEGTKEVVGNEMVVSIAKDHTLWAVWNINTVSFDTAGGDSAVEPMNATYKEAYGPLPTPTRTGYTFLEWLTEEVSGEVVTSETVVTVPYPHTLYARWVINTYTLTFDYDNGSEPSYLVLEYNKTVSYPEDPVKRGYEFAGWGKNLETVPSYNDTITAQWTPNKYTVTLEVNDGSEFTEEEITVTFDSAYGYLPTPAWPGYTFVGWFTEDDMGVTNETIFTDTDNHTLHAEWVVNKYTVTLDPNGGDGLLDNVIEVTYDSSYGELIEPKRIGHTFAGWSDSLFKGNEITSSTTVSIPKNHTLYATWTVNNYTMTFSSESGKTQSTLSYNEVIIYPVDPSKSFHKFTKWCTNDLGDTEMCDVTHVPAKNLTFTAFFDVDSGLVAGTATAITAGAFLIVLIIVIAILARITSTVKHKYEFIDVELEETNRLEYNIENRIGEQVEATNLSNDEANKKLSKLIKKTDKTKTFEELLTDLEADCEEESIDGVIESFRTTTGSSVVASAIRNGTNLVSAAGYLSVLYTSAREEEYEVFEELYFGMKDIDNFMDKMDEETITFSGAVSGFTTKKKAIQFLFSKDKENNMPSGVLFKVSKGMGYRIGMLDKDTDEVLFELGSVFKVESMKEITKGKYVVVNLSFVSPKSKSEMVKI